MLLTDSVSLDNILRLFEPLVEVYELLESALFFPLELIPYIPSIIGSAILIVVFSMILKFIIGS